MKITPEMTRSCASCYLASVRRGDSEECRRCADEATLANPKPRWREGE